MTRGSAELSPRTRLSQPLQWYRWHPLVWLADRRASRLSWAEKGLCRELVDLVWQSPLPADPQGIADLLDVPLDEIAPLLPRVLRLFEATDAGLVYPPLEEVRTDLDRWRKAQADRRRKTTVNHGSPGITAEQEKRREEKRSTPPTPSGGPLGEEADSPELPSKRKRKSRAVLTYLKDPEVEEVFERIWESWPPSRHEENGGVTMRVERGARLPAEENFQTILDENVATAEELRLAAEFYCLRHPKVLEGYVQHVRTFFQPSGGRWAESLRAIRAWREAQAERTPEPGPETTP